MTNLYLGSGKTYTTLPSLIAAIQGMFPLTDNIQVNVSKGQVFGDANTSYTIGNGTDVGPAHQISFVPDSGTAGAIPSVFGKFIMYYVDGGGSFGLKFSDMKIGYNGSYLFDSTGAGNRYPVAVECCLVYLKCTTGGIISNGACKCALKSSSVFASNTPASIDLDMEGFDNDRGNNFFGIFPAGSSTSIVTDELVNFSCPISAFAYGAGKSCSFTTPYSQAAIGDPHLASQVIQAATDDVVTMAARDVGITVNSTTLLGKGTAAYSISPDIIGTTRPR